VDDSEEDYLYPEAYFVSVELPQEAQAALSEKGNDTICGGAGRDTLIGNDRDDCLFGEGGDDKLFGDNGRDSLDGSSGRDACRTGETARRCEGQAAASERPRDPPRPPCPPAAAFPCN
jgi:hypothetical protein